MRMPAIAATLFLAFAVQFACAEDALTVADFNSGQKPNNLGNDFGAWDRDPEDFTQSCYEEFNAEHARGGSGFCMMLEYDVDSPKAAYNGFWMQFGSFDASSYESLVLWLKSDTAKGGAARLKIEMKTQAERGAQYVEGISSEWQRFEIPLFDFLISDYSSLQEMVIVFEDHTANPKEGIIYVDDIQFVKARAASNAAPSAPESP